MKKLLCVVGFILGIAFYQYAKADNEFAYANNNANGFMFFTYSNCVYKNSGERIPDNFYVYSTDANGNKLADGCYSYKYPFYFVTWNGGGNITVNVNTITFLKKL